MHRLMDPLLALAGATGVAQLAAPSLPDFEKLGSVAILAVMLWYVLTKLSKSIEDQRADAERHTQMLANAITDLKLSVNTLNERIGK